MKLCMTLIRDNMNEEMNEWERDVTGVGELVTMVLYQSVFILHEWGCEANGVNDQACI